MTGLRRRLALAFRGLSGSTGRCWDELGRVVGRWNQGDAGARARLDPADDWGGLGSALNLQAEKAEAKLRGLAQGKALFEAIFGQMFEGAAALDSQGRILAVNAALAALFQIDPVSSPGRPFLEVLRHNSLDQLLRSVLRDRRPQAGEVRLHVPEEHVFEAYAGPLNLGGEGIGALLVLRDVTRLRRLEQVRKDFVANVSHELRTPLASIKAFAETLRLGAIKDRKAGLEFLAAIEKDADRMTRLVDDLLELSAIESGRRPPALERLSLLEAAREAVESLRPLADKRRIAIEVRESPELPPVAADRNQLRQVFGNLLDNAVKFNREGGAVSISAESRGGIVTVSVQDTGPGIPSQDLPRIFERFYRVDRARSRELGGTGLGLAIVKHIVESHGGSVGVESRSGQGCTFFFSLPTAP